ncbi:MAG TPA: hypothetical protein DD413_00740 [Ruminococcus sp.]|nr:hypothetical protein [Ruminococcus sp.]
MKKIITIFIISISLVIISTVAVNAEENAEESSFLYDLSEIYNSLSDEAKQSLVDIGAASADPNALSEISFNSIVAEILDLAGENVSSPLKGLISITALLLLSSILSAYKSTLNSDISTALNITTTLCITCAVAVPAISVINNTASVISTASNLMIAYIPIMVVIMATSGHAVSGASYYSMMLAAGEGVGQLSSKVIVPLLNMFLGLSITSSVSPDINLSGFINMFSKAIKWILGFGMTIFTAVLALKQLITSSLDDVSTRAVRFTLNSFIPIVGSALSDAYKTVLGSVGLLKSGVGVFVILSVAVVFLPVILQSIMWIFTLWIGKSTAEVLGLSQPAKLLEAINVVFSTMLAILLCIMSIYIISTAIVLIAGKGTG